MSAATSSQNRSAAFLHSALPAELLLSAIVDSSDDAIVSKSLDGTITSWNRGAERVFGYTAEEILGRPVLTLIPPDRHHEEVEILSRLQRGERIDHFESIRRRKDGTLFPVALTISPIFSADGQVIGASKVARDISAQRKLTETRNLLAAIVESSDDAIISKDITGIITSWNKGAERMFGYTAQEVIGQPITMLMPPAQANEEPYILARIGRGERIEHYETIRRRKDGELIDVSLTISAIRDAQGVVVGASKIARDITRQKRHEDERAALLKKEQEARAELEALVEAARGLSSDLNLESVVQRATDVATRLTGAKFGAFFYNVVNERQESYVLYALSGAPRSAFEKFGLPRNTAIFSPTFNGEGVVRLPDVMADPRYGKSAPHHSMPKGHLPVRSYLAVPVISRSGEVIGGLFFGHPEVGVFTERAERIVVGIAAHASVAIDNAKLYAKLESSLKRLDFSLAALEVGDWSWDVASDLMTLSDRTADLYGLPRGVRGKREDLRAVIHPDDRPRARDIAQHSVEHHTDYAIDYRVNHPVHGERWLAVKGRPQFGDDGKLTGMIGVVQDITDRKRTEVELRESRATLESHAQILEQHVAERTARLKETIGELEAFSYTVSHDMRTPLRSMHGYADRLLRIYRSQLDDEAVHHLERISKNAERLELLVRDVLAYSRVSKADVTLTPVDLERFLDALLPTLLEVQHPGVKLTLQRPLPVVRAHEAYLSQVFSNLLQNAVKFAAPDRPPEIDIRATVADGRATISICDNGIGIAPEHFDRIFEIFGRVYSEKKFEGTGIGLSIVRKAVQRMGGEVSVQSTPGAGSCFSFTLPTA